MALTPPILVVVGRILDHTCPSLNDDRVEDVGDVFSYSLALLFLLDSSSTILMHSYNLVVMKRKRGLEKGVSVVTDTHLLTLKSEKKKT